MPMRRSTVPRVTRRHDRRRLHLALVLAMVAGTGPGITHGPAQAATTVLFQDSFDGESNSFPMWNQPAPSLGGDGSAVVQGTIAKSGQTARISEQTTAGSVAYLRKTLAAPQTDLTASGDVYIYPEGLANSNVPIFTLLDANKNRLVTLYRQNVDYNQVWLQYNGGYYKASATLPLSTWGHFDLHVVTNGSGASTVQVLFNGVQVYQSTTASLGTAGVQALQIGNSTPSQQGTIYVDNITMQTP